MSYNIVIRHLTGTQKGKDQVVTAQEASLGTGPGNTVRLDPVWDKGVAPSHARVFRDLTGSWVLEDAGSRTGTFINGQRVTTRVPVAGSIVIELGAGGPKMEIMLPPPLPSAGGHPQPQRATAGASSGGVGKLVLALVVVALLGGGAWLLLGRSGGDSDQRLQNAAKSYEEGVGFVIGRGKGVNHFGTAWAVAPNMFATNAHVALPMRQVLHEGGSVYVAINKHPDQRFRVKAAYLHPRYLRKEVSIDGRDPVTQQCDVGILVIEGNARTVMRMASPEKLHTIDSGHRIAFLGFPLEDLNNGGYDQQNPVAIMQSGIVTAATDFWLAKSAYENRQLIQHNLPTVGGSSGSPIFDADGDVIGILSSGNMIAAMNIDAWGAYVHKIASDKDAAIIAIRKKAQAEGASLSEQKEKELQAELDTTLQVLDSTPLPATLMKRAPSAALVNYAQRIDMLQELIAMIKEAEAKH